MRKSLLFFYILFSSYVSDASYTARQTAFAGSGALSQNSIDGMIYNPASLSLESGLDFGLGYNSEILEQTSNSRNAYAWVKDSIFGAFKTSYNRQKRKDFNKDEGMPLAAAFSFQDQKEATFKSKNYQLGLSKVLKKRWSAGLLIKYFDGSLRNLNTDYSFWTADVGFVYWMRPKWIVGLSGRNILDYKAETAAGLAREDEKIRLSSSYTLTRFFKVLTDAEVKADKFSDVDFGVSLETKPVEQFGLILGAFRQAVSESVDFGLGLSFLGPRLSAHYGFKWNTETKDQIHSIDLRLPLW